MGEVRIDNVVGAVWDKGNHRCLIGTVCGSKRPRTAENREAKAILEADDSLTNVTLTVTNRKEN